MGKKTNRFCNPTKMKGFQSKTALKCVLRLSCVIHGPIYGSCMGWKRFSLYRANRFQLTPIKWP